MSGVWRAALVSRTAKSTCSVCLLRPIQLVGQADLLKGINVGARCFKDPPKSSQAALKASTPMVLSQAPNLPIFHPLWDINTRQRYPFVPPIVAASQTSKDRPPKLSLNVKRGLGNGGQSGASPDQYFLPSSHQPAHGSYCAPMAAPPVIMSLVSPPKMKFGPWTRRVPP